MPGSPTTPTTAPWPSIARSNKPSTADISHRRPDQIRLRTPDGAMPLAHAQQAMGGHRFIGTLNAHHLRLTEQLLRHQPVARWTR